MESFLNNVLQPIVDFANTYIIEIGPTVGGVTIAIMVILLLGTGLYLTVRTGFVQISKLKHGVEVTTGKYDDPDDPGDVTHFQALTTALSATVGIGNIAGVAMAIHWGGPGALFWMWVTAFLGMATKYSEVTLAQKYRTTDAVGNVAGGPMYYIERGLGPAWKPMAIFFAVMLGFTAFLTGNAVQAIVENHNIARSGKARLDPLRIMLLEKVLIPGIALAVGRRISPAVEQASALPERPPVSPRASSVVVL